jgi:2-polyprenyl-3-methyl-5-hydroxy-6-metoxy-1,4-benzoquinol methylase
MTAPARTEAYGQTRQPTLVDRFGCWLSARAIRRHLPPGRTGLKVVEVGCGYHAANLVALAPLLEEGVGIDFQINPALKGHGPLRFIESTAEEALGGLASETYDCVLIISVLEHLWNPQQVLQECHRLLKAGGVLLVNVPTWRGKFFLEFSAFKLGTSPALEMDDHKMYYDRPDLWPLLVRAGFKPSRINLYYHKFGLNLFGVVSKS